MAKNHEAENKKDIRFEGNGDAEKAKRVYRKTLRALQVELIKVQMHVVKNGLKVLVLFEGRDAAGKDGTIRRFVKHMNPRHTHVVALDKPSERQSSQWYFQRYVPHLPSAGEIVLFNRSWYNRAGVERVMGFCTAEEYEEFMMTVPYFEQMLRHAGIQLYKYYLDIRHEEQKDRLEARKDDPLKQWKLSAMDGLALKHWDDYSTARNQMFTRTNSPECPWIVVKADNKREARIHVIENFLSTLDYDGKDDSLLKPDPSIVFPFLEDDLLNGRIAP
jgi:polyphosphate kinase 2